jgi:DNA replication and repair protein RecF
VRKAELNGTPLDSPLRLSGEFCSVIFSPEHLGLVKEGPQLRRKFIDAAICQLSPRHASAVLEFKKALAQRNALLKDIPRHSQLMDTLDTWDDKLCRSGAHIAYTRLRYLKRLEKKTCDNYGGIAGSGEKLRLEYLSPEGVDLSCELSDPAAALKSISHELNGAMRRTRALDIESGYTHAGPHRDDLDIYINEKLARSYGSQGQQRSVVLALKLAEAAVLRDSMGEPPVLLLDDVMSELDRSRQDYLLNSIEGMQIFITCCEPTWPAGLRGSCVFEMISGVLKPGVST